MTSILLKHKFCLDKWGALQYTTNNKETAQL